MNPNTNPTHGGIDREKIDLFPRCHNAQGSTNSKATNFGPPPKIVRVCGRLLLIAIIVDGVDVFVQFVDHVRYSTLLSHGQFEVAGSRADAVGDIMVNTIIVGTFATLVLILSLYMRKKFLEGLHFSYVLLVALSFLVLALLIHRIIAGQPMFLAPKTGTSAGNIGSWIIVLQIGLHGGSLACLLTPVTAKYAHR